MNVVAEALWLICRIVWFWIEAIYRLVVPPSAKDVRDQVAFVTGAGRGIGREIALLLAVKHRVKVAVCDVNEANCSETARMITEAGGTAQSYRCDVTKPDHVADVAKRVRRELGDVDILVNNAGVLVAKSILQLTDDEIRRTIEVNAVSQFWTVREFLPSMIARKRGHILILVSAAGRASSQLLTDYSSSKFAAHGFAEALTDDLRYMNAKNIDVTTVYPLFVNTNMVLDITDRVKTYDRFNDDLTPRQVAEAAVDGLLRGRRYVYVPKTLVGIELSSILPYKAAVAAKQFLGSGFYETSEK